MLKLVKKNFQGLRKKPGWKISHYTGEKNPLRKTQKAVKAKKQNNFRSKKEKKPEKTKKPLTKAVLSAMKGIPRAKGETHYNVPDNYAIARKKMTLQDKINEMASEEKRLKQLALIKLKKPGSERKERMRNELAVLRKKLEKTNSSRDRFNLQMEIEKYERLLSKR